MMMVTMQERSPRCGVGLDAPGGQKVSLGPEKKSLDFGQDFF